jgi:ATP-binding cassette subfamily B protein
VNRNLAAIAQGRTVISVSHRCRRWSCGRIMAATRAVCWTSARITVLLGRCETYSSLWRQQTEHLA